MIPTICFLQFVAVATPQNYQIPTLKAARPTQPPKNHVYWVGAIVALAFHLAWFTLLADGKKEEVITPPQPIMVNWISAPTTKPDVPQPQKTTPKVDQPKPKAQPKSAKHKPVIATPTETTSPMAVQSEQHPAAVPVAAPAAVLNTPANTAATSSTAPDLSQTPLTLPHLNADYLDNPVPAYPSLSRQLGEQGKVLLRVLVNAAGEVEQVTLRKSSGFERLDSAAHETVKQWRFVSAHRGQQAVSAWVVVPISFTLEG